MSLSEVRAYLAMITCELLALDCQVLGEEADYEELETMTVSNRFLDWRFVLTTSTRLIR